MAHSIVASSGPQLGGMSTSVLEVSTFETRKDLSGVVSEAVEEVDGARNATRPEEVVSSEIDSVGWSSTRKRFEVVARQEGGWGDEEEEDDFLVF